VSELRLTAGRIEADVQGSRVAPYAVAVRVRTFTDAEWTRVLDMVAAQIGHAAALFEGELPPALADDVRAIGLDLLPGAGELQPRCSCPDWADPCKHAAAVCYLVADALDADPFAVLLLRGLERAEVLAALRARRGSGAVASAGAGERPGADGGVLARDAWSRAVRPRPQVPLPPRRAGRPTILGTDPPRGAGIDPAGLRALAADAAIRALDLALGGTSSGLELTAHEDLARRAAMALDPGAGGSGVMALDELARRTGMTRRELLRRAVAWREGGRGCLAVLDETWDPEPAVVAAGRAMLGDRATVRKDRVTRGDRQLRLGRDGRWYPFRRDGSRDWVPDGAPIEAAPAEPEVGDLVDP
jgi:hypothetical protein